ncbi:MAG TPA: hypothetical protein VGR07_03845 [Thermoanaerobaculia bacterium]|jgi:hypothetical protein|nr:hypothetical protein [Thermoanaerobaculia bacterium]
MRAILAGFFLVTALASPHVGFGANAASRHGLEALAQAGQGEAEGAICRWQAAQVRQ